MRRYSAVVPVKTTSSGGHVVLTEAGVAVQDNGTASAQTVT
jgi:hypothetical protein